MQLRTANYMGETVTVNVTDEVQIVLAEIDGPRGSFAYIRNHVSESKREVAEIADRLFITNPRYDRFLQRKIEGLDEVDFLSDVVPLLPRDEDPKFDFFAKVPDATTATIEAMFDSAVETLRKRYAGEDSSTAGNRHGQAVSNVNIDGIKCHVVTEKDDTGHMVPVLDASGNMTVDSIKIAFYEIREKRVVHQKGVYKKVNSRADVIMRDTIERAMERKGVRTHWSEFSLQKRNYTAISMNSATILGWVRDAKTAELDAAIASAYRFVGNFNMDPMSALRMEADYPVSVR